MEQIAENEETLEKKETLSSELEELKKDLKRNLIFGTERVLKLIRQNKIEKVYISKNVKENTKKDLMYYSKINNFKIVEVSIPNDELGVFCKKQFSVSVIGVLKE